MMKEFYPGMATKRVAFLTLSVAVFIFAGILMPRQSLAQELSFNNSTKVTPGQGGTVGSVYRFTNVTAGVDALVTISAVSDAEVNLASIDKQNFGNGVTFQPQVKYPNSAINATGDTYWWMEFTINFVQAGTSTPIPPTNYYLTALDLDGNGTNIQEYVDLYDLQSYTLESPTLVTTADLYETINGAQVKTGERFIGTFGDFNNIDTTQTNLMATAHYVNSRGLRIRAGGHAIGNSGSADRTYSFWFKSFTYTTPTESTLPVKLESFRVQKSGNYPQLSWLAATEINLSHYVVQRSTDGSNYDDVSIVFTGDQHSNVSYSYTDKAAASNGVLYYRLKMVDIDGKFEYSPVRLIRMGQSDAGLQVQVYPNPAQEQLRITIPSAWQQKTVKYEIYSSNGRLVKQIVSTSANQTELLDISALPASIYHIKVSAGNEQSGSTFIKNK
jgi:hypothetical protein